MRPRRAAYRRADRFVRCPEPPGLAFRPRWCEWAPRRDRRPNTPRMCSWRRFSGAARDCTVGARNRVRQRRSVRPWWTGSSSASATPSQRQAFQIVRWTCLAPIRRCATRRRRTRGGRARLHWIRRRGTVAGTVQPVRRRTHKRPSPESEDRCDSGTPTPRRE